MNILEVIYFTKYSDIDLSDMTEFNGPDQSTEHGDSNKDEKSKIEPPIRHNDNFEYLSNPAALKKFKASNINSTLFIKKLGRRKLWQPNKYKKSRKIKVAESFNELIKN